MTVKNTNLREIVDNEGIYQYRLVLNAKKPIDRMFMLKLDEIISTRNLSVKDAILDVFASNCVYVEDNVYDTPSFQTDKSVDNKNVDKIGVENNKTGNVSGSASTVKDNIDNKDISKDSSGIAKVDPDVTQEMKSVLTSMFGN